MPVDSIFRFFYCRHLFFSLEEEEALFLVVVSDMLYVHLAAHVWGYLFKI